MQIRSRLATVIPWSSRQSRATEHDIQTNPHRVLARLRAAGHDARSGSRKAQPPFDWDDPTTWENALRGMGAVYVNYHPDYAFPGAIENLTRFTRVAASCGVERLVILTGRGEYYAQLGEEVIAKSGLDYTIVRSAWFAQNFSEGSLWEPAMEGVVPMPGGDLEEPIIDIDDLADVIVPMDLYDHPATEFVAGFIGSPKMNFIKGRFAEAIGATTLGVRPEHITIGQGDDTWEGKVTLVERLGHDTILYVRVDEAGVLTVSLDGQHHQNVGDTVHLWPNPEFIHKFNEQGKPIAA